MAALTRTDRRGLQLLADAGDSGLRYSNKTAVGTLYWQTADRLIRAGLAIASGPATSSTILLTEAGRKAAAS